MTWNRRQYFTDFIDCEFKLQVTARNTTLYFTIRLNKTRKMNSHCVLWLTLILLGSGMAGVDRFGWLSRLELPWLAGKRWRNVRSL